MKHAKGKYGEKSHFAKLTNEDAENIRKEFLSGIGISELSDGYAVSESTIRRIINNQTYQEKATT